MIAGLGVDIVEIDRFSAALQRRPRIRERVFTAAEREYCDARNRPAVHYALRFAAKEAVLKALGTGFSGMRFTDVEVVRAESGRPTPRLYGRAAEVAAQHGVVEMHVSLSYTHSYAVASAVAITEQARPRPDDRPDPKAELAASFKEARALLDRIEATGVDADGEAGDDPDPATGATPSADAGIDAAEA